MPIAVELLRKSVNRRYTLPTGEGVTVHGFTWSYYPVDEGRTDSGGKLSEPAIPMKRGQAQRAWSEIKGPVYAASVDKRFTDKEETPVHRLDNPGEQFMTFDCEPLPGERIGWIVGTHIISIANYEKLQLRRQERQDALVARQIEDIGHQRQIIFAALPEQVRGWINQLRHIVEEHQCHREMDRYESGMDYLRGLEVKLEMDGQRQLHSINAVLTALLHRLPRWGGKVWLNSDKSSSTCRDDIGESKRMRMFLDRAKGQRISMRVWHASVPSEDGPRMYHPMFDGEAPFPYAYEAVANVLPDKDGWCCVHDAWALTNSVDRHWAKNARTVSHKKDQVRSTSVGDVVEMPDGSLYRAESIGWKRTERAEELKIGDRVMGFVHAGATTQQIMSGEAFLKGSDAWVAE